MDRISGENIFFACLDWGLGHATRSTPVIRYLARNNTIIIGVTDTNRSFFDREFPGVAHAPLPSYTIRYSRIFPAWLSILARWPVIRKTIAAEHAALAEIVTQHKISVVISDNRYGVWHPATRNILITHQLKLKAPWFPRLVNRFHQKLFRKFSEIWVPDSEDRRLSGDLSDASGILTPVRFIGPQSMLRPTAIGERFDLLILLSGPEPQRSVLEEIVIRKFDREGINCCLVRGTSIPRTLTARHIRVKDAVFGDALAAMISGSRVVMCRSGYSSLMDMHVLRKEDLILVPTPGQTEQEYLARLWRNDRIRVVSQSDLGHADTSWLTARK